MKKVEKIFVILYLLVFLTKIATLLGLISLSIIGLPLLLIGFALSSLYFYAGFIVFPDVNIVTQTNKKTKETKEQVITSIFSGIIIGYGVITTVFTIQRWPLLGFKISTVLLILLAIFLTIMLLLKKSKFYRQLLLKSMFVLGLNFISLLVIQTIF
ncbi:MAG: hypothetical protein R2800_04770 [Flavipsychrobacter sp.]